MLDLIEQHRSTIVFANSRRLAERLCGRLNELAAERAEEAAASERGHRAGGPRHTRADHGPGRPRPGAPAEMARAHHGSVSRQERAQIEEALKAGRLPAVVATSSLELGIDMGAVDLVIQVESPPSVASGLQRIGRAGHNVGDVSRGVFFPKYQGDLVQSAVVAQRMRDGAIEEMRVPRNPLDVLAQQIVAMVAMDDWGVGDAGAGWSAGQRRSAASPGRCWKPCSTCWPGVTRASDFAELRPRLVWDRTTDILHGRPGAQRLAVTSGGTIPDRGLFGVFLAGAQTRAGTATGSASSTRRWCTSRGSVTCSCSAPARGGSRTSPPTRCSSPPLRASRAGCRSGTATRPAARPSSAGRSARSAASSARRVSRRPPPGCARRASTSWRRRT